MEEGPMKTLRRPLIVVLSLVYVLTFTAIGHQACGQSQTMLGPASSDVHGRPVIVPMTIRVKEARREPEELQNIDLTISEDGEPQTVLSIRAMATSSPITLALL